MSEPSARLDPTLRRLLRKATDRLGDRAARYWCMALSSESLPRT